TPLFRADIKISANISSIVLYVLLLNTEPQKDNRTKNLPPVNQRPHFGISDAVRLWVFNRHRDFYHFMFQAQSLEQQIRLQFIAVQPLLPEVDSLIIKDGKLDGAKAA